MVTLWLYLSFYGRGHILPDTGAVWWNIRKRKCTNLQFFFGSSWSHKIICCALKLSSELLKQSVAMKAIFKNTHKGEKKPRGKRWCRGGESKPNLMLLLIYLILTAQRLKKNMEWNRSSRGFFFFFATQLIYLFIPLPLLPSLPLTVFTARIDSEKTQLMDLLWSSTQHRASFDVLICVGFPSVNRQEALWTSSQNQRKSPTGLWKDLIA